MRPGDTMKEKNLYECHVFVCTNKKEAGKACCADKGAADLRMQLKEWAAQKYGKRVRVNAAGCLGFCSQGIATVVYPQSDWKLNLQGSDLPKLQQQLDELMEGS